MSGQSCAELVRRRSRLCAFGGLLAVVSVACSGAGQASLDHASAGGVGSPPATLAPIPGFDNVPDEQRAYFEDGRVTLQEYQEAYGRFVECAQDAGVADVFHEVDRDPISGLISYSVSSYSDDLLAPGDYSASKLNDCYQRWFAHTEIAFQVSDPAALAAIAAQERRFFDAELRPCLERIGVVVPDDLEVDDDNWRSLDDQAMQAFQDGRCTGVV